VLLACCYDLKKITSICSPKGHSAYTRLHGVKPQEILGTQSFPALNVLKTLQSLLTELDACCFLCRSVIDKSYN
jgi:hypothetical protein